MKRRRDIERRLARRRALLENRKRRTALRGGRRVRLKGGTRADSTQAPSARRFL